MGGGFNNQSGPILIHIYSLLNINLYVKYISNLIRTFFGVMLGPYIKSRGARGTKMPAHADLITMETYVQGEQFENQFFIYGPKCIFFLYFGLFRGA